jgi:hypothetical protein
MTENNKQVNGSTDKTSTYGLPWTTIGRFPDFLTADVARQEQRLAGLQAKIHRQRDLFAVKIRALPVVEVVSEGPDAVAAEPKKKARAKTDTKGGKRGE